MNLRKPSIKLPKRVHVVYQMGSKPGTLLLPGEAYLDPNDIGQPDEHEVIAMYELVVRRKPKSKEITR